MGLLESFIIESTPCELTIAINPEKDFFRFIDIMAVCKNSKGSSTIDKIIPIKIGYELKSKSGRSASHDSFIFADILFKSGLAKREDIGDIIPIQPDHTSLTIRIVSEHPLPYPIEIRYSPLEFPISIKDPMEDFKAELGNKHITKLLFSAPFGHGKTTFLDHFFTINQEEYLVVKLRPVNYSIASNEDIFRYIKCEVLSRLIENGIMPDDHRDSLAESITETVASKPSKLFVAILKSLSKIGVKLGPLALKLEDLAKSFQEEFRRSESDEERVLKFMEELHEKEGSIFEDNFYTQTIRQLLNEVKKSRKVVLLIDDVDRLDPEHVFRIFNVLGAHFDDEEYLEGYANKFGFDKVILVCDYSNIVSLFSHKYGPDYNFEGYISKFYSTAPYLFSNRDALYFFINELSKHSGREKHDESTALLKFILMAMVESGEISLRDLLKLRRKIFLEFVIKEFSKISVSQKGRLNSFCAFNVIAFLSEVLPVEALHQKLTRTARKIAPKKDSANSVLFGHALLPLLSGEISTPSAPTVFYSQSNFQLQIEEESNHDLGYSYIVPKSCNPVNGNKREINTVSAFTAFANAVLEYKKIIQTKSQPSR